MYNIRRYKINNEIKNNNEIRKGYILNSIPDDNKTNNNFDFEDEFINDFLKEDEIEQSENQLMYQSKQFKDLDMVEYIKDSISNISSGTFVISAYISIPVVIYSVFETVSISATVASILFFSFFLSCLFYTSILFGDKSPLNILPKTMENVSKFEYNKYLIEDTMLKAINHYTKQIFKLTFMYIILAIAVGILIPAGTTGGLHLFALTIAILTLTAFSAFIIKLQFANKFDK